MVADSDQDEVAAMLGGTTMDFYFNSSKQKTDVSMMGGLMRIQTIVPVNNPSDAVMLMDIMGQKYQITEMTEDDLASSNNFMNMDEVMGVSYDTKDRKQIAGYSCYLAKVKMSNDMEMKYYITEDIKPPVGVKSKDQTKLKGFPLEMTVNTGAGITMVFTAKEILSKLDASVFDVPTGYTKKTMEEFQNEMGNLNFGN